MGGSSRFTMRRTVWRCQTASSSTDSQVLAAMPMTVMRNDAIIACHTESTTRPSRRSAARYRIRPLATIPSRPAVHRMIRAKSREMIGHSTALSSEIRRAATIAVQKSLMEMPGRIQAMNQKLTDVINSSIRWRRSGIRPGVRRGSVGVVTASGYGPVIPQPSFTEHYNSAILWLVDGHEWCQTAA